MKKTVGVLSTIMVLLVCSFTVFAEGYRDNEIQPYFTGIQTYYADCSISGQTATIIAGNYVRQGYTEGIYAELQEKTIGRYMDSYQNILSKAKRNFMHY